MAEYIIEENDAGRRIDRVVRSFLKKELNKASLSAIYSYIRKGFIRLNGKKIKPSQLTHQKDVLYIADSIASIKQDLDKKHLTSSIKNTKYISLKILKRTEDFLFINKPLGIATHGTDSIDEVVKNRFAPSFSLSFSVGALHRLDKDTTGILTFSQSLKGARAFSKAIKTGSILRYYIGINEGYVKNDTWKMQYKDAYNNLKEEITQVFLIEYAKKENLSISCYRLITGKKHQIRRGAINFGTPLFCDKRYGSKSKNDQTYFLHSFALNFENQLFLNIPKIIIAPLPKRFLITIKQFFKITWKNIEKEGENTFLKHLIIK